MDFEPRTHHFNAQEITVTTKENQYYRFFSHQVYDKNSKKNYGDSEVCQTLIEQSSASYFLQDTDHVLEGHYFASANCKVIFHLKIKLLLLLSSSANSC